MIASLLAFYSYCATIFHGECTDKQTWVNKIILSHDTHTTHCFQTRAQSHIQRYKKPSNGRSFEEREFAKIAHCNKHMQ